MRDTRDLWSDWPSLAETRARYPVSLGGGLSYSVGLGGTFEQHEIEVLASEAKRQGVARLSSSMVGAILRVKRHLGGRIVAPEMGYDAR